MSQMGWPSRWDRFRSQMFRVQAGVPGDWSTVTWNISSVTLAELLMKRHRELKGEERTSCRMAARLFNKSALALGRRDGNENPIFQSFRVHSFPTSFLIDASGKILWRGVGHSTELKHELSTALRELGFETTAR